MPQDSKARRMRLSESWRHFTLNEKASLHSGNMWMADSMKPSYLISGMGAEMEQQPMLGMQSLPWDVRPVLSGSFPHTSK